MPDVEVRRATVDDATVVASIHTRSWQDAYRGIFDDAVLDALAPEQRLPFWRRVIEGSEGEADVLVAEAAGEVVGFCAFGPAEAQDLARIAGEVHALYVSPGRTGAGVGSALLGGAEKAMAEAGIALRRALGPHRERRRQGVLRARRLVPRWCGQARGDRGADGRSRALSQAVFRGMTAPRLTPWKW